jgi:hypothetical protein
MATETIEHDGRIRDYYGNQFYGVLIDQTEDGDWYADGHVDQRRFAAAMAKYSRKIIGERIEWTWPEILNGIEYLWAKPYTPQEMTERGWMWGYHVGERTADTVKITRLRA